MVRMDRAAGLHIFLHNSVPALKQPRVTTVNKLTCGPGFFVDIFTSIGGADKAVEGAISPIYDQTQHGA